MGRFMIVVPPLHGHINPTLPLGRSLQQRGHQVAWAAYPEVAADLLPADSELVLIDREISSDIVKSLMEKCPGLRGAAALRFMYEDFALPLARVMKPGLERAIDRFRPDVMVVDQLTFAGSIVAENRGIPWATSASTSAEFMDPFAGLPKIRAWVDGRMEEVQRDLGFEPKPGFDPRFSKHLVILFTTPELLGAKRVYPPEYAFVGPSIQDRPEDTDFPWDWLDPERPHVLVSLGTVSPESGDRFFQAVVEAFEEPDRQIILVALPDRIGPVPDHVLVRRRVPQLTLMKHLDAVLCHGGHNTVCESLAHGLPLVVCPIRDDQPLIAKQVVESGAGLRVRFGRPHPGSLRSAVDQVLKDPGYRKAAERIQASFRTAGGGTGAAERLEELL